MEKDELLETKDLSSDQPGGVVEIIMVQTDPVNHQHFRLWLDKIHAAELKFPGFKNIFVQPPKDKEGDIWTTLLWFDTAENLDRWLDSPERHQIIDEGKKYIKKIEGHKVYAPFAGWFADSSYLKTAPALWKQTMLVLVVLFPIVMLEQKFLTSHLEGLNFSLAMFIGNAISVSLISWPMMPIAIYFLQWWLNPSKINKTLVNIAGFSLVVFIYLVEIFFFWA